MNRWFFISIVLVGGCVCQRWAPAKTPADVPGEYVFYRQGNKESGNLVVFNSDGGVCHRYTVLGRRVDECGSWSFEIINGASYVGIDLFCVDEDGARLRSQNYEFEVAKSRRFVVSSDDGLVFYSIDSGM